MIKTLIHTQTHCHCPFAIMVWNKDKLVGLLRILITGGDGGGGGGVEREKGKQRVFLFSYHSAGAANETSLFFPHRTGNRCTWFKAVMRQQHRPQEHHILITSSVSASSSSVSCCISRGCYNDPRRKGDCNAACAKRRSSECTVCYGETLHSH
jgi:hypothetical protein